MIHANELRVDNWASINGTWNARIAGLSKHVIIIEGSDDRFTEDDLRPIPLTPEILQKCGFEKNEDGDDGYYHDLSANGILFVEGDKHKICEVYLDMIEEVRVRYVHQLQNLYFALTGTELTIEL